MVKNVKCPQCGAIVKSKGVKFFRHCGSAWSVTDNLVDPPKTEIKDPEIVVEEEGGEEGYTLPPRQKPREVVKELARDEYLCPYCHSDIYSTETPHVYYCMNCERYLEEEEE